MAELDYSTAGLPASTLVCWLNSAQPARTGSVSRDVRPLAGRSAGGRARRRGPLGGLLGDDRGAAVLKGLSPSPETGHDA